MFGTAPSYLQWTKSIMYPIEFTRPPYHYTDTDPSYSFGYFGFVLGHEVGVLALIAVLKTLAKYLASKYFLTAVT